jgi:periplasmic divalent cation tolerance protein
MAHALILTTCGDRESADRIAGALVQERLAACVQRMPIESTYLWQGELCNDTEIVLFIKSRAELFGEVAAKIRELHPYELPEVIQLPITDGLPEYLRWIEACTKQTPPNGGA